MLRELNEKMQELSKSLVGLHVSNVFKKNKGDLKLKDLSNEEKEKIRNLFKDLEAQVNQFVSNVNQQGENRKTADDTMTKTRTTLREIMRKKQ